MNKSNRKTALVVAVAAIVVIAALLIAVSFSPDLLKKLFTVKGAAPTAAEGEAVITALDVGQSSCTVIKAGNSVVMIDTGDPEASPEILAFLNRSGIKTIDYMVLTHPHADHIGGAADIISSVEVKEILYLPLSDRLVPTNYTYLSLLKAIAENNAVYTPVSAGQRFPLELGEIEILFADGSLDELNDCSIVLRYRYGSSTALFMGDAEKPVENRLVQTRNDLKSDILFVGHHGSASSTYRFFVKEVKPRFAVISCGADNSYGYPSDIVIGNLQGVSSTILETDIAGNIHFILDGRNISYSEN